MKLGLGRMQEALARRGNPEKELQCVHIAGTNGKGSVGAMLESVFREAGYKTGHFCSPHLHRYVERVQVNGRPISEKYAAEKLAEYRQDEALSDLTFFEHTTLLGFETFRDEKCNLVFLETGLGGRLDSTNVVVPEVSVITNIGLDHTRILGNTYAKIAKEKAGIIKKRIPLIVGARNEAACHAIEGRALVMNAPSWWIGESFDAHWRDSSAKIQVGDFLYNDVELGLKGRHQIDNAACVVSTAHALRDLGYDWTERDLRSGLKKARWSGRLESHRGRPDFVFDAAHNKSGCETLAAHLAERAHNGNVVLLFSAMADKNHRAMLRAFDGLVSSVVYAVPKMTRASDPTLFAKIRKGVVAKNVREGVAKAKRMAGHDGLVVVAGSIFLLSEARAIVKGVRTDPPIGM